jgi:processive 1,2-diacylglycerol beta-glucosyltransferase
MPAPARPGGAAPHALLLSGSLGQGHDVMAEACADSLRGRGWTTETVDAMALLGRAGAPAGEAVFRRMLALPGLYDAFHFSALRPGSRLALLADAAARARLVPKLRVLVRQRPPDLVVSVFATAASAVNCLPQRQGRAHIVFCTDASPHRLWVQDGTDLFLVTSEVAACAVRRYRPRARIALVPVPLRAGFYTPPTRAEARVGGV